LSSLRSMAWALLPFLVAPNALDVAAQSTASAQVRFTYVNPKLQPQKYVLTVEENGDGRFRSEGTGPSSNDSESMPAGAQDRPIHISKALRETIFATARKNKLFTVACEDGGKNIAFQGTKTLEFEGPEGKGSCTYNWSKISTIDKLTDQLEAVAATLEEGSRLQRQYEHGRLSLDSELELLTQMAHDGRAIELENIAPVLQTIAGDDAVLQRAQRRARALLQGASND
jgi:hypothetical protein